MSGWDVLFFVLIVLLLLDSKFKFEWGGSSDDEDDDEQEENGTMLSKLQDLIDEDEETGALKAEVVAFGGPILGVLIAADEYGVAVQLAEGKKTFIRWERIIQLNTTED